MGESAAPDRPAKRVLRYEVPVDDCFHEFELSGGVLHVACRDPKAAKVEFWALDSGGPLVQRGFVVVGTGHPWPPGARYVGTALAAGGLVWHLLEGTVTAILASVQTSADTAPFLPYAAVAITATVVVAMLLGCSVVAISRLSAWRQRHQDRRRITTVTCPCPLTRDVAARQREWPHRYASSERFRERQLP